MRLTNIVSSKGLGVCGVSKSESQLIGEVLVSFGERKNKYVFENMVFHHQNRWNYFYKFLLWLNNVFRDQVHYILLPEVCYATIVHCCINIILSCRIITVQVHSVQCGMPGLMKLSLKLFHNIYNQNRLTFWPSFCKNHLLNIKQKFLLLKIKSCSYGPNFWFTFSILCPFQKLSLL